MNIFELIALLIIVSVVALFSGIIGSNVGVHPLWIGLIMGGILIVGYVLWGRHADRTEFPPCESGTCEPKDFHGIRDGVSKEGCIVECRCGQRYLRTWDARLMVYRDSKAVPYKKRVRWGKWVDDVSATP